MKSIRFLLREENEFKTVRNFAVFILGGEGVKHTS